MSYPYSQLKLSCIHTCVFGRPRETRTKRLPKAHTWAFGCLLCRPIQAEMKETLGYEYQYSSGSRIQVKKSLTVKPKVLCTTYRNVEIACSMFELCTLPGIWSCAVLFVCCMTQKKAVHLLPFRFPTERGDPASSREGRGRTPTRGFSRGERLRRRVGG